ncbi:MAG: DUF4214 domain-containing protein [Comamonadaceae bacterium]|nr:MAG: DUF4214 domain-containing protein [Comamonadaceae bacterium]
MANFTAYQPLNLVALPDPGDDFTARTNTSTAFIWTGPLWVVSGTGVGLTYRESGDAYAGIWNSLKVDLLGQPVFELTGLNYNVDNSFYDQGYEFAGLRLTGLLAEAANWLSGTDTVSGSAANDVLAGFAGNDAIDGGFGIDTAAYAGVRSDFTIANNANGSAAVHDLRGFNGDDALVRIERLQFLDRSTAIDFGTDLSGHAAVTAKILGAVFGPDAVDNLAYAGIGLQLLDSGVSQVDLAELAVNTRLGTNASNAQVVEALYTNVIGTPPAQAELAYYTGLLDSGNETRGELAMLAANTAENAARIDLVGLSQTGLDFTVAA